jgi:hypothetical protein
MGRIKALKIYENYPDFNTKLNGAQTGEPFKVKSLDGNPDYYIIPLVNNDEYVGSTTVFIIDGKAIFGSVANFKPVDKILPVSIDKAISILKSSKGLAEVSKPILVYKTSKLSADRNLPFWEFTLYDGTNYYVNQDGSIFDKIEITHLGG